MQKIGDIPNARADSNGEFTDGNVVGGVPPTLLPAEWFNTIQRELVTVVQDGGLTLDPNDDTQVLAALKKLFLQSGNNLSEIKDAGPTAITQTLANLGLGEGSAIPVGVPLPWPTATPPEGWLKCNGAIFDKVKYPKLALAYPSGILPDLRGEFIRGWDDGLGVDAGREILSIQGDAIRNISGGIQGRNEATSARLFSSNATGVFRTDGQFGSYAASADVAVGVTDDRLAELFFDASRSVPTANENRPRNIAFNYIVRAA